MPAAAKSLTFKRLINTAPAEVYRAFTHATALRDWLCNAAQADPRPNGRIYLWWDDNYYAAGHYTALTPGKKVAFTWSGWREPGLMTVQVTLKEKKGGTLVSVTHGGLGSGAKWKDTRHAFEQAWPASLENLQSVLETGVDLRLARRPRLGIFIDEFNPEIAAKLRVPAKQGIRLSGTAEGTGAHASGLQKDDVIIKLNGKKAVDFTTLGAALHGLKAGDSPKVVFYRGAQKLTVPLMLSSFPTPDYPATAAELAEVMRAKYAEVNATLEQLIDGLTEAQAEHRPAPSEWTLKETFAHFICTERDTQSWFADMLNDNVVNDYLEFRPNVAERHHALMARYPTLTELFAEFRRAQAETLSLITAFPPQFVARKHMYFRAAQWLTDIIPSHVLSEHMDSMKAMIESAGRA
jgi:uncharacterized protein YndB with AHSA1/START domain